MLLPMACILQSGYDIACFWDNGDGVVSTARATANLWRAASAKVVF
jgi:hypothetical protein